MTLILNIEDPLWDAIEEILELIEEPGQDGDKLFDIQRIAMRAIVEKERQMYISPVGNC